MNQQNPEDESLDRLLSHLTAVELSDGFGLRLNQRILASSKPAGPARQLWPSWSLGFASLFGMLLMLAVHRNAPSPVLRRDTASSPHFADQPQPLEVVLDAKSASKDVAVRRLVSGHHRVSARGARPREAVDAAELRSFPAPPLPLTQQEKLLARIASSGDPREMAMLSPDIRASLDARQKLAFHQAFEQGIPQFQNQPITQERGEE